ncbi:MAG: HNH endonuclease signature motif containing protein [Limisphaerales bacterium]
MHPSTNASGKPYDAATIEAVWNKAITSSDHPPMRVDAFGALIWREGYGNTSSKFGWEIGHRCPLSKGGGDEPENLEPLQWENNRRNGHS